MMNNTTIIKEESLGKGSINSAVQPFLELSNETTAQSSLRAEITTAYLQDEQKSIAELIEHARMPDSVKIQALAKKLTQSLRSKKSLGLVEGIMREYSLTTPEGVALMCLAEALLRIPDRATRSALIRDKISQGDWRSHLKTSAPLFVNASTWGLLLTGKLIKRSDERSFINSLRSAITKGGEPLILKTVNMTMRIMGKHFANAATIEKALLANQRMVAQGFLYSYDMLGEAALTADDAEQYNVLYTQAIHAIGTANAGKGVYDGSGISIKLSALHPRYSRSQRERVLTELYQRVKYLVLLAHNYDVGISIDAEETDRLDLSLDIIEMLCHEPKLQEWNGIGFVVQAYQKRSPMVLNYLIDLAKRTEHRLMIRLVKGAYWDTEIKQAQIAGLSDYPVFTRKVHTDICYLACARKLLAEPEHIYPQFATHNAQTLAAIYHLAGPDYYKGQYEFQGLYGMGEALYKQVVGPIAQGKLNRPCRLYAPVGSYDTLLPYLVRRLLENGSNVSFVNRITNTKIPISVLIADPVELAEKISPLGAPHPRIPLPRNIYRNSDQEYRVNSAGVNLCDEALLNSLTKELLSNSTHLWRSAPLLGEAITWESTHAVDVLNPADHRDVVGQVMEATSEDIKTALKCAVRATSVWRETPVIERSQYLKNAASLIEEKMPTLIGLIVREGGKSIPNAIAEVREGVDFLRYYAKQAEKELSSDKIIPIGPVLCINPWNFPMAIFTGQIAAALAAGNPVIAKPANQTSLIAAYVVELLHQAGIPIDVLQLAPGKGSVVGAQLAASSEIQGVIFTGSTEVAQSLNQALAQRLNTQGNSVTLIAETGGQNAMVVDSSALAEQVVNDVITSSFDSAGQRCSALRILCVQEEVADRFLKLLKGAMQELQVSPPDRLSADVGPVIDKSAQKTIQTHIETMREAGNPIFQISVDGDCAYGSFTPPTIIEIQHINELKREVFGPVLHVLHYKREQLDELLSHINATGYGLTFGLHSRIDETIEHVQKQIHAGNIYINRNVIGAVVGVQPFGGRGLSGTGPKAGGPLYLLRLVHPFKHDLPEWAQPNLSWPVVRTLLGPTGESNSYQLNPRGKVLCIAQTDIGVAAQLNAVKKTGCTPIFLDNEIVQAAFKNGAGTEHSSVKFVTNTGIDILQMDAVLFEGESKELTLLNQRISQREGEIITVQGLTTELLVAGETYALDRLLNETSISVNTAAVGGNATLINIG